MEHAIYFSEEFVKAICLHMILKEIRNELCFSYAFDYTENYIPWNLLTCVSICNKITWFLGEKVPHIQQHCFQVMVGSCWGGGAACCSCPLQSVLDMLYSVEIW